MTKNDVDLFEKLHAQLEGLYAEISALSKKSPTDGINKFKLKFINHILIELNKFLKGEYRPFLDFETFEEDDLPTNSDVILILSQYLNCMEKLRADNIHLDMGRWYWIADGGKSSIRTAPPAKIKEK